MESFIFDGFAAKMSIFNYFTWSFNWLIWFLDLIIGSCFHGRNINQHFLIFKWFLFAWELTHCCLGTFWAEIITTATFARTTRAGILRFNLFMFYTHRLAIIVDSLIPFLFFSLEQRLIHKFQIFNQAHLPLDIWAQLRRSTSYQHFIVLSRRVKKVDWQVACSIGSFMLR